MQQKGYLPSEISHIRRPLSVFVTEDGKTWFPRRLYGDGILLYRSQVEEVFRRPKMTVIVTDGWKVTHMFPVSVIDYERMEFAGAVPPLPIKIVDLPAGQLVRISAGSAAYLEKHNLTADTVIQKYAEGVRTTTLAVPLDEAGRRAIREAVAQVKDEILHDSSEKFRPTYTVSPVVPQESSRGADPQRQGNKERFPIL